MLLTQQQQHCGELCCGDLFTSHDSTAVSTHKRTLWSCDLVRPGPKTKELNGSTLPMWSSPRQRLLHKKLCWPTQWGGQGGVRRGEESVSCCWRHDHKHGLEGSAAENSWNASTTTRRPERRAPAPAPPPPPPPPPLPPPRCVIQITLDSIFFTKYQKQYVLTFLTLISKPVISLQQQKQTNKLIILQIPQRELLLQDLTNKM